jgi:predicted nucleotidyltransferase
MAEPVDTQAAGPSMAELARVRAEILAAAARHGATNVRVFGSVARGDADATSDVDFLVDFEPGRSLLDILESVERIEAQAARGRAKLGAQIRAIVGEMS